MSGTIKTVSGLLAGVPTGGSPAGIMPANIQDIVATLSTMTGFGQQPLLTFPVGQCWYVDNTATGANDGTSWANAWTSFQAINWAVVAPGNTIYISGGTTSQTYSTALTFGASGTVGSPITISGSPEARHNGEVIIDGTTSATIFTTAGPVNFNSQTNVTIQNLTIQNGMENCLVMGSISSGTIIAQNLKIHTGLGVVPLTTTATTAIGNGTLTFGGGVPSIIWTNAASGFGLRDTTTIDAIPNNNNTLLAALTAPTFTNGGTSTTLTMTHTANKIVQIGDVIHVGYNSRGIRIDSNTGGTVIVRNCTIDTPNNSVAQTDCIYAQLNSGTCNLQILNNILLMNNIDPTGHNDCYQDFQNSCSVTFAGNLCWQPNGGWNNHCIILTDIGTGTTQNYYNNILIADQSLTYGPSAPSVCMLLLTQNPLKTGTANIYNNTMVGGGWAALQINDNSANGNQTAVTMTSASPAVCTWTGSNFAANTQVSFTGSPVPTGITSGQVYFVAASPAPTANTFSFSATQGGANINTSSTGTTVIGLSYPNWVIKNNIISADLITQSVYNLFTGNITATNIDYNVAFNQGTNLRANFLTGSGVVAVRGTQSRAVTTGLWYLEWQYGYTLGSGSTMFGFANSTQILTSYPGSSTNSIGYDWQNSGVYTNAGNIATVGPAAGNGPFDIFAVAFNTTTSKLWIKNLTLAAAYATPGVNTGGWNNDVIANQNPATGTGGVTTAGLATGPWFPMVSLGGLGDHLLFNGTGPFVGALPAGATAWGGTLNPADKNASLSMTAAIGVVSGTTEDTWAMWQTAGYDAHGVNSDPLFTAAGQYTIQTGSPAKNAGLTIAGVPTDYAGYARPRGISYCIGAYEYPI